MEKQNRVTRTEIFRLYYTPAANAANMIKPVLSAEAQVSLHDAGRGRHRERRRRARRRQLRTPTEDMLVVTDYPEKLDQRPRGSSRRSTAGRSRSSSRPSILRATLQDDNALGVDFNASAASTSPTCRHVATGADPPASGLGQALSGADHRQPGRGSMRQRQRLRRRQRRRQRPEARHRQEQHRGCSSTPWKASPTRSCMANPKVLVLNKQKGEVHVGSEQGYRTAVTDRDARPPTSEVPGDRYAAGLPPVHRRQRQHPHGDPARKTPAARSTPRACRTSSSPR